MTLKDDLETSVNSLATQVERKNTIDESFKTYVLGWAKLYQDAIAAGGNPAQTIAQIGAITDAMIAKSDENAAFLVANTPAA